MKYNEKIQDTDPIDLTSDVKGSSNTDAYSNTDDNFPTDGYVEDKKESIDS